MKRNDKQAYIQKSKEELQKNLAEVTKNYTENRVKLSTGALKDTSIFKKIKYEIALIKSLLGQNK